MLDCKRYILFVILFIVAISLAFFNLLMSPPSNELGLMALFLGITAFASALVGYGAYRFGWVNLSPTLRWTLLGGYQLSSIRFQPKVTYRYAFFQGDDPGTPANEAFDPLLLGFYDWGTWWQGEIAGEYFLANSNLISHQVRGHLDFSDAVGSGVIFYKFENDQPETFGPGVASTDVGTETDFYVDWKLTSNFSLSLLGAFASPGPAAEEATGRTKSFKYGMLYLGYSF